MSGNKSTSSLDDPLGPIVESFLARFRRGERPSLAEYEARHPDLADEIRDLLPALVELELGRGAFPQSPADSFLEEPRAKPRPPPERLGDYRILAEIGRGAMGVVYEAERECLQSRVALKVIHEHFRGNPQYLRRFRTEARSAAQLHHTNIVPVFDFGVHDGVCYYAMQLIAGQPLDRVLEDVIRLREGAKSVPADQATVAASQPEVAASAAPSENEAIRTLSQSLLSGRFAAPTAGADSGVASGIRLRDSETGSEGTLAFTVRPATEVPAGASSAESARPLSASDSGAINSSTLAARPEQLYYREIARLGEQAAAALAYAHEFKVVHRDIKPSNLMLDARGNLWVTDFGLAKFLEGEDASRSENIAGTLRYMSPERFQGVSGPAADVYALGATLYEMLTLRPLFEGKDRLHLIQKIVNEAPAPPRTIDPQMPRDLEAIVLKAVAKDPNDRFRTAEELRKELDLFCKNLPTLTRPLSPAVRFGRWCKRNPVLACLALVAAALLTLIAIGSSSVALMLSAKNERIAEQNLTIRSSLADLQRNANSLRKAELAARLEEFEAHVAQARAGRFSRRQGQRFETLQAITEASSLLDGLGFSAEEREKHRMELRNLVISSLALPDVRRIGAWPDALRNPSPDGQRFLHIAADGSVRLTHADDGAELGRLDFSEPVRGAGWLDEAFVFVTTGPKDIQVRDHLQVFRIDRIRFVQVHDERGVVLLGMGHGRTLVVSHLDGSLHFHDLEGRRPSRTIDGVLAGRLEFTMAFALDAPRLAVQAPPDLLRIIDLETLASRNLPLAEEAFRIDLTPDGQTLAVGLRKTGKLLLLDLAAGRVVREFDLPAHACSFDGTGQILAVCPIQSPSVRFLEPATGRVRLTLAGHGGLGFDPRHSRDGRMYAAEDLASGIHQLWLFDPAPAHRTLTRDLASSPIKRILVEKNWRCRLCEPAIDRAGRLLAIEVETGPGEERGVVLWDLALGRELGVLPKCELPVFTRDGDLFTQGPRPLRWPVRALPDRLVVGPPTAVPEHPSPSLWPVWFVARSPDGTLQADFRDGLLVRETARGSVLRPRVPVVGRAPEGAGHMSRFSPDGRFLAAVSFHLGRGNQVHLWRTGVWDEPTKLNEGESSFAFAPDSQSLAVEAGSGAIRLIDLSEGRIGQELARLEDPDQDRATSLAFTIDGGRLVSASDDGHCLHVWDLRTIRRELADRNLDWPAPVLPTVAHPAPLGKATLDLGTSQRELDPKAREEWLRNQLKDHPHDADARCQHLLALLALERYQEADAEAAAALRSRPTEARLRAARALAQARLGRFDEALADLETAHRQDSEAGIDVARRLAYCFNDRAWSLAHRLDAQRDPRRAVALARQAVALDPGESMYLNTLGAALYRAEHFTEAVAVLQESLEAGAGRYDAFDLFFTAMARHRLGDSALAHADFDRAVNWLDDHQLNIYTLNELSGFRSEAEAVLAGPPGEMPANVFAP